MFQSFDSYDFLKRGISGTVFLQSRYTILRFFFFWSVSVCLFASCGKKFKIFICNFFLSIFYCRFKRKMQDPDMIDLTNPLYLVYVSGPTSTSHNNIS